MRVVDGESGAVVEANLVDDLRPKDLIDVEDEWSDWRLKLRRRLREARVALDQWPQSLHWDWVRKSLQLSFGDPDDFRVFGIRVGHSWQAAMITLRRSYHSESASTKGQPLIYVDYLEVASWNWTVHAIRQVRRYKALGSILLRAAVTQSRAEGYGGRVALHALPQAAEFYCSCGFRLVTFDMQKRLPLYELTDDAAGRFAGG